MVSHRVTPLASLEYDLSSPQVLLALCYPSGEGCSEKASRLSRIGVEKVLSFGRSELPLAGIRVLGKGHSSVVLAALLEERVVAVKVRRADSKRRSLFREGELLQLTSRAGAAPRPLYWDDEIVIMEAVLGPELRELMEEGLESWAIAEALWAARALDVTNVEHLEINRPWRSVMFSGAHRGAKALIVDYESSSEGCSNVPSLIGGLLPRMGVAVGEDLRELLRRYKAECSLRAFREVEKFIAYLTEQRRFSGSEA
ncbi:MAG: hypothetical protein NZ902_04430 [Acidilobaceae archaeon]|nr:hypothetical protein [Acidilobaceae archaeon]MCX8165023.1 hypothetical protein [Acidilobaceae archaeon]MDW7974460.1 hypothetical protein [Sulfolobales archaeon]